LESVFLFIYLFFVESVLCSGSCFCFCRFKSFSPVLNLHSGEFAFVKMKKELGSVGLKRDRDRNAIRMTFVVWTKGFGAYAICKIPAKSFPIYLIFYVFTFFILFLGVFHLYIEDNVELKCGDEK